MKVTLKGNGITAVVDTFAATIESLVDAKGQEHYWQYDPARWPRRTSVCFPICGSLKEGVYRQGDGTYELPNHGFLREFDLEIVRQTENELTTKLVSDETMKSRYPFDFAYEVAYKADNAALTVTYTVENTGRETMYYSTGAHYTYALPAGQAACRYFFDGKQTAGRYVMENGLVADKTGELLHDEDSLSMDGLFEQGPKILEMSDFTSPSIAIGTDAGPVTCVEFHGFPYAILWAPAGNESPFACIEPWDGLADAVSNDGVLAHKKGIVALEPGCKKEYVQVIHLL